VRNLLFAPDDERSGGERFLVAALLGMTGGGVLVAALLGMTGGSVLVATLLGMTGDWDGEPETHLEQRVG